MLNIASIRECTTSEGPGKRVALWVQGCLKRCKNCCNPHMQALVKKHIYTCDDIIKIIQNSIDKYGIEGVTFLGGEPILQSKGLLKISKWCKENNVSIILFSGYKLDEIYKMNLEGSVELLENIDVLIDGEYIDELYDESRGIVGSSNQNIYFFTNRYNMDDFKANISVEFIVSNDCIKINGWPII